MKKLIALLLALVMVFGLVACGKTDAPVVDDAPAADKPAADAPASDDPFAEHVTLRYVIADKGTIADYEGWDNILAAINEITNEKINATIEVEFIPAGEFTDKMNMKYNAGEQWDVAYSGVWNEYLPGVAKGAFAELSPEVLETYAPWTMANTNSAVWNALTVNGKIYGLPIEQGYVRQNGITFNKELAEKYGVDYSKIKSYDDIDDYLAAVKAGGDEVQIFLAPAAGSALDVTASMLNLDLINGSFAPGAVIYNDESLTVINPYATEQFKKLCEKYREWNLAGYFPEDVVTGGDSMKELPIAARGMASSDPTADYYVELSVGYPTVTVPVADAYMTTSSITATINAISATSVNVERAVAFADLLNGDEELLNLFLFGLEGQDYEWVNKDQKLIKQISGYSMPGWCTGNTLNAYVTNESMVGMNDLIREMNATADGSVLLGFSYDAEPMATELAQCSAVISEYIDSLLVGAVDVDTVLPEFLQKLEAAGANEVIADMQRQVNEWAGK